MLTYGFYDSIKADRRYYPHQFTDMMSMLMPNGIVSGIGDGFAVEAKDAHTVKVRSGLCFYNGYYVYNDATMEYAISDEVYPVPGLRGIIVEQEPYQTEYPAGNPIDLDGIQVSGLKSNLSVVGITIDTPPQADYPYGNNLDLGALKVMADLVAVEESRVGDCYIVLEFDEVNRSFELKAINTNDYRESVHVVLAVFHKAMDKYRCENAIGKTVSEYITPVKYVTGMFQNILIDDIVDTIEYDEDEYLQEFKEEKETYWDNFIATNKYILYHQDDGTTQYQRFNQELVKKEDDPIIVYDTVEKGTTSTSVYIANTPTDAVVQFKSDPYGLIILDMYQSGNYIRINHEETSRKYSICLVIR